jgi:hypothetical protein
MTRAIAAIFCIGFLASITAPLSARPDYYQQFLDDPLRSADAEGSRSRKPDWSSLR